MKQKSNKETKLRNVSLPLYFIECSKFDNLYGEINADNMTFEVLTYPSQSMKLIFMFSKFLQSYDCIKIFIRSNIRLQK